MSSRSWAGCWLLVVLTLGGAVAVHADVFRPAYLELREAGTDVYDVLLKLPAQGERVPPIEVRFPDETLALAEPVARYQSDAYMMRWQVRRDGGFVGQTVAVDGIATGASDVIVRIERADGTSQVEHLLPERPAFVVVGPSGAGEVAWTYLVLGIEHILGGVDHLLFVLSLLLIVRGGKPIFLTITAFTVAHSITLVAATLGWVHIPGPPVEAMIALSIVFVAAQAVQGLRGHPGLTARAPWVVAFSFGLLHGFGFAGALAEVGLPQSAIPIALLMFNVGVELGQLMFVVATLGVLALFVRAAARLPQWLAYLPPYAIGTVAMFWVFERAAAF